ncbi:hypothetical protein [Streptomyces sp. MJM8645]|uniref:hypothetical protein n=1 Tax=Streptomycetaceae TaxID=2062 RepID=UPI0007AF3A8F|nr:hypothetical protein [Streptomyces sp. MJM8645]
MATTETITAVATPVCALLGVIASGWLAARQASRRAAADEHVAVVQAESVEVQAEADAETAEAAAAASAAEALQAGFVALYAEHRAERAELRGRISALETGQARQAEKLDRMAEDHRRWRDSAIRYIRLLRAQLASLGATHPTPEDPIRADLDP